MTRSLKDVNNAIGIDIGGTKVKIACIDSGGKIIWSRKEPVIKESSEGFLEQQIRLIREAAKFCKINNLGGIGLALPAVIGSDNDTIIQAPNLPVLDGIKLNSSLSNRLKSCSIELPLKLGFDGTASVVAEVWQGVGRGYSNIITISIGTGIGGGFMVAGRTITGINNVAGSVGWIRSGISEDTPSFEEICAGPAIARQAEKLYGINNPKVFFDRAERDRKEVSELLGLLIRNTGTVMANLVSIFNPETIVFAGSVGLRFKPYLNEIKEIIKEYAQPVSAKSVKLGCSILGNNAGVIGAAGFILYKGQ